MGLSECPGTRQSKPGREQAYVGSKYSCDGPPLVTSLCDAVQLLPAVLMRD